MVSTATTADFEVVVKTSIRGSTKSPTDSLIIKRHFKWFAAMAIVPSLKADCAEEVFEGSLPLLSSPERDSHLD